MNVARQLWLVSSHPDADLNLDLLVIGPSKEFAISQWRNWLTENEWNHPEDPSVFSVPATPHHNLPAGILRWHHDVKEA